MSLQLGFDGAVKLTGSDDESLRQCLTLTRERYRGFVAAIDAGESPKAVYWRLVFAILSVHSPLSATFAAYSTLRLWKARFSRMPSHRKLHSLLLIAKSSDGNVTQYCYAKATYIIDFDKAWQQDSSRFFRNGESDADWRTRIQRNVRGLGLAKASFAVCLSSPTTADICCVDTHIFALFMGRVPGKAIGKRTYLAIEERIRKLAREHGLSTFATQWALWDAHRGIVNAHSALATI